MPPSGGLLIVPDRRQRIFKWLLAKPAGDSNPVEAGKSVSE